MHFHSKELGESADFSREKADSESKVRNVQDEWSFLLHKQQGRHQGPSEPGQDTPETTWTSSQEPKVEHYRRQ